NSIILGYENRILIFQNKKTNDMSNGNPKEFVKKLELQFPNFRLASISEKSDLHEALESGGTNEPQGFINNKSLVAFTANVSGQNRQDCLNSTLLAQLVADKMHPDEEDIEAWYKAFTHVLSKIGWIAPGKEFSKFETDQSMFEMENVVLDILGATLSGSAIAIIAKTLGALKKLSDSDNKLVMFEKNSHSLNKGSFQIALADETNGQVSMTMSMFHLSTSSNIKKIVFFKSAKDQSQMKFNANTFVLNPEIYGIVRMDILQKIGDDSKDFIASLEF
ncbi:MAG: hypothetical protein AAGG68_31220, partial [Bacteroidota bacterium]